MSTETLERPKSAKMKVGTSNTPAKGKVLGEPVHAETLQAVVPAISPEIRRGMIAEAAYFRALQRSFAPGSEVDDWLLGEQEIMQQLGPPSGA